MEDVLAAGPGLSAIAPAAFAAVGLWTSATSLRGAMIAVAALGLALAALALPLLALSQYAVTPRPAAYHREEAGVPSAHSS